MILRGTIRREGLEGGLWVLRADDGQVYQLLDAPAESLTDGQRVEVSGRLDDQAAGIGMVGPMLVVRKVTPIR